MRARFAAAILMRVISWRTAGLCLVGLAAAGNLRGDPSSVETVIDDASRSRVDGKVHVSYEDGQILFRIGDPPLSANKNSRRVRYRFEGLDAGWRQRWSFMQVSVRFYDEAGDQVGQENFQVGGKSPGWNGSLEGSIFTPRRELLTVPEHAARACVFISSAGPPSSIGCYVVADVVLSRAAANGNAEVLLESSTFLTMGNSTPLESRWIPDGTHPSMAGQIEYRNDGRPRQAFAILDDDPVAHAEWHFIKEQSPTVRPGEKLTLEWNEFYEIGNGDLFDVAYARPAAGRYRFETEELDMFGVPTGAGDSLEIVVAPPYWETGWFLITVAAGSVLAFAGGGYLFVRWIVNRKVKRWQQQHMLESERLRIARNIHDDLGARLTQISLVSALAAKQQSTQDASASFNKITRMTRDLVAALYETVWTVDPENDHLDSLATFLCQLVTNMCEAAGLRCRLDMGEMPASVHVSSETRHNIILVIKEVVHNAVKHSGASEIHATFRHEEKLFAVTIRDNGKGFDLDEARSRKGAASATRPHGLANIETRVAAIDGKLAIHGVPGEGTSVSLSVPI